MPHFNFEWVEIYTTWKDVCKEESFYPFVSQVLQYDINAERNELDLRSEFDWIPLNPKSSQIGPKKRVFHDHTFYTNRATPASCYTINMIMENIGNDETTACIWITACALQLIVDFPVYWRGVHNHYFLDGIYQTCSKELQDKIGYTWSGSSKRIFPYKYFSGLLLRTTDHLSVRQLIRFAVKNAQYYLDEWLVVQYTINGLSFNKYQEKCFDESSRRIREIFSPNGETETYPESKDGPDRNESEPKSHKLQLLLRDGCTYELHEGQTYQKKINSIERNIIARRICLEHYGATCVVCGLNFEKAFGEAFSGIIEVHHTSPLGRNKGDRLVDPIDDLVPLCPNCHRMIHRKKDGVYSPEELRKMLKQRSTDNE